MATNFQGYLFRTGQKTDTSGYAIFPLEYIAFDSWDSTPNQREEIKAYRDDNTRDLTRVTAAGRKSVFSFTTRDNLTLEEKIAIQSFFTTHESDTNERKIHLTFWNEEDNDYDDGDFYRPNMSFKIKKIEQKTDGTTTIIYNALTFEFVEY